MTHRIVSTLGPKDAGDITKLLATIEPDDTKTIVYMGVILGKANGVSYRSNKFDPEKPAIALTGVFEATPYDPDGETVQGVSLFLPGAVQSMLVKAIGADEASPTGKVIKLGQKIDVDATKELLIRVEIGLQRADGDGVGYRFVINHAGEAEKIDALEGLRADLLKNGNDRMKALAAGKTVNVKALAAPAPKKPAGSRKKK